MSLLESSLLSFLLSFWCLSAKKRRDGREGPGFGVREARTQGLAERSEAVVADDLSAYCREELDSSRGFLVAFYIVFEENSSVDIGWTEASPPLSRF